MYSQHRRGKASKYFSSGRKSAPALLLAKRPRKSRTQNECCAICLQAMSEPASLEECKHSFCSGCISQWAKINLSCPLCKHPFTSAKVLEGGRFLRFEPIPTVHEEEFEEYGESQPSGNSSGDESHAEGDIDGHGYERDGFVVDDDFVEYDSADDALQSDEEDFQQSQNSDIVEPPSRRRMARIETIPERKKRRQIVDFEEFEFEG